MDVREKMVDLIKKASYECDECARDLYDMKEAADSIADFLITNGVTVQEWVSVKDHTPTEAIMNNADKIRSMSDEELIEFIKNIKVRAALCKAIKNNDAFEELCSAEWLKQPAE